MYDYYVNKETGFMTPWENKVSQFTYTPGNFSDLFVPNVETTRLTYFLDTLVANKHHVMLVGPTGVFVPFRFNQIKVKFFLHGYTICV